MVVLLFLLLVGGTFVGMILLVNHMLNEVFSLFGAFFSGLFGAFFKRKDKK